MNFTTAISTCFRKYADFSGRASRSEYWYFQLFVMGVSTALAMLLKNVPLIPNLFSLAVLVPTLAVVWRRMHDIGKRGTWSFIVLVPVIGLILMIIWCCKNGESGENEYGDNPKGE